MEGISDAIREGQRRRIALSVAEAAVEAGVGRDQVYAAIRDGRLEARKWGRRTIITYEALKRFLDALPPCNCRRQHDGAERDTPDYQPRKEKWPHTKGGQRKISDGALYSAESRRFQGGRRHPHSLWRRR
jgi:excisionase family DNA binding protein